MCLPLWVVNPYNDRFKSNANMSRCSCYVNGPPAEGSLSRFGIILQALFILIDAYLKLTHINDKLLIKGTNTDNKLLLSDNKLLVKDPYYEHKAHAYPIYVYKYRWFVNHWTSNMHNRDIIFHAPCVKIYTLILLR